MATEYGFIYVLGNESMPGIYKIGFTLSHPKARMDQLSSATACPTPFEMLACFGVENPRDVEASIHRDLSNYRINASREFFSTCLSHIQDIVRSHSDYYEDLVNTYTLDAWAAEEDRAKRLAWKIDHFQSQCADPISWPEKVELPF